MLRNCFNFLVPALALAGFGCAAPPPCGGAFPGGADAQPGGVVFIPEGSPEARPANGKKPAKTLLEWAVGEKEKDKEEKEDKGNNDKKNGDGKEAKDKKSDGEKKNNNGKEKDEEKGGKDGRENGEEPPKRMETDRPHFPEAASTVGRGRAILEAGYTFTHDRGRGER